MARGEGSASKCCGFSTVGVRWMLLSVPFPFLGSGDDCDGCFEGVGRGGDFGAGSVGAEVVEGGPRRGWGFFGLVGGDVPDMGEKAGDVHRGLEFDLSEVGGFGLDEDAAVGSLVDAFGLEVTSAERAVSFVVLGEDFGSGCGGFEDGDFAGGLDLDE